MLLFALSHLCTCSPTLLNPPTNSPTHTIHPLTCSYNYITHALSHLSSP